ncbi:MAG: ABC transporter family substrate-binding protein [Jatrophihabitans sp.]
MRLSKKTTALVGVAVAAAMGLSACSSGGGGGNSSSNNKKKQASNNANQTNPLAYDQVPDGGNLRWAIDSFPPNFNIFEVDGNELGISQLVTSTLPPVWHFDAGGKPTLDKDVVDKAQITNQDPQVVEYHINPKAVWSDGTQMTYKDFQGMFNALNGKNKAYKAASTSGYDQIGSVERGATDQDVKVTFAKVYPEWQSLFNPIIPAALTATPESFNTAWINGPAVSGGPFIIDKIDKTAKTITVKRNDKWFGQKPKLDTIQFKVIDVSAQPKAFQGDQVDFFDIGSDPAAYKTAQATPDTDVRKAGGPNFRHIDLSKRGPLADLAVRQAVMLSMDRVNDAKAMLSALDWPATVLNSHIWMNNQAQYKSTCGDYCNQDIAKADSLLEGAGWKKGSDGIYAKDGKALNLSFVIPAGVASSATEAGIQQNAMKKAGIKVTLKTVPSDPFFSDYVIPGNYDLTIFSWIGTPFPVSGAKQLYASTGESNYGKIGSKEIDDLLDQATSTLDPSKADDLTYEIDQKLWEEGHSVTLYQRPDLVACKKNLVNEGAFGFADVDYTTIGFKK